MKIYLAGPEVFFPKAKEEGARLKKLCAVHGFEGVFPLDGPLSLEGMSTTEAAHAIFQANIDKIQNCSAVIANLSPFRGPGMDAGTAFEIGYAHVLAKPVIGWSSDLRDYLERVADFYDGHLERQHDWRDPHGLEVEDFNQIENLMITCALTALTPSFEAALAELTRRRL